MAANECLEVLERLVQVAAQVCLAKQLVDRLWARQMLFLGVAAELMLVARRLNPRRTAEIEVLWLVEGAELRELCMLARTNVDAITAMLTLS